MLALPVTYVEDGHLQREWKTYFYCSEITGIKNEIKLLSFCLRNFLGLTAYSNRLPDLAELRALSNI